jgi:DNA damage-binding protein 1
MVCSIVFSISVTTNDVTLVDKWTPPNEQRITLTSVNANSAQIVLAIGKILIYLRVVDDRIVQQSQTTLTHEVACIDISPMGRAHHITGGIRVCVMCR